VPYIVRILDTNRTTAFALAAVAHRILSPLIIIEPRRSLRRPRGICWRSWMSRSSSEDALTVTELEEEGHPVARTAPIAAATQDPPR
jgi:hypothetical protein